MACFRILVGLCVSLLISFFLVVSRFLPLALMHRKWYSNIKFKLNFDMGDVAPFFSFFFYFFKSNRSHGHVRGGYVQQILFAKSKADMERESIPKCKICRVFVRQGGRKSEEVETVSASRRRGRNSMRKSAKRRR